MGTDHVTEPPKLRRHCNALSTEQTVLAEAPAVACGRNGQIHVSDVLTALLKEIGPDPFIRARAFLFLVKISRSAMRRGESGDAVASSAVKPTCTSRKSLGTD